MDKIFWSENLTDDTDSDEKVKCINMRLWLCGMDPACSGLRVDDEELKVDGTAVNAERLSLLGCYAVWTAKVYRRFEGVQCVHLQGKSVLENALKRIDTEGEDTTILSKRLELPLILTRLEPSPPLWGPQNSTQRICLSSEYICIDEATPVVLTWTTPIIIEAVVADRELLELSNIFPE